MAYRKKLIGEALPLDAINVASAREKSIRPRGPERSRHGQVATRRLALRPTLVPSVPPRSWLCVATVNYDFGELLARATALDERPLRETSS